MLLEVVKSLVHDGYTALMDQRCHSAEQMFSQLLNILNPSELKVNWEEWIYLLRQSSFMLSILCHSFPPPK